MPSKVLSALAIAGAIIIVGALAVLLKPQSKEAPPPSQQASPLAQINSEQILASRYIPYSIASFAAASDTKRVLYFHAPWCPICVPIDKEFSSRSHEIPDGVTVFKVDYDTEKELGKKYAVTYQHTFVHVDGNGSEITKWNGGGIAELKSKLK